MLESWLPEVSIATTGILCRIGISIQAELKATGIYGHDAKQTIRRIPRTDEITNKAEP